MFPLERKIITVHGVIIKGCCNNGYIISQICSIRTDRRRKYVLYLGIVFFLFIPSSLHVSLVPFDLSYIVPRSIAAGHTILCFVR